MTEYMFLTHWLTTSFILLMWCVEQFAHRWIGYQFVYRLYAGLPVLVCFNILFHANAPLTQVPEIVASLSVAKIVPITGSKHVSVMHWIWFSGTAVALARLFRQWWILAKLSGERIEQDGIPLLVSKAVSSPCLKGIFRPVILLPDNYRGRFTADELALIVAHEQVHARRMDNAWNMIAFGLRAMF